MIPQRTSAEAKNVENRKMSRESRYRAPSSSFFIEAFYKTLFFVKPFSVKRLGEALS
jgi:hypothetical protein